MKYSELVEGGASETQIQGFLAEGDQTAITFRVSAKDRKSVV